ncbi:MAG TPA: M36 family metallopeptidase [Actinomycetota bacterium]|nr:M36 family metallopeptidase [Actinomycetota bacterium]
MVIDLLRRPARASLLLLALAALAIGVLPVDAAPRPPQAALGFQGEVGMLPEIEVRTGVAAPSPPQVAAARRLGATVRWNDLGTPQMATGNLGPAFGSTAVAAARGWMQQNHAFLGLSREAVRSLRVTATHRIGSGHAVQFQQQVGGVRIAPEGLLTVGLLDGQVILVASSLAGDPAAPAPATLAPQDALSLAARNVGLRATSMSRAGRVGDWATFSVKGLSGPQLVRPVAVPLPGGGTVAAYETFIVDMRPRVQAFRHFIDARGGGVLIRRNEVDFQGEPKWDLFPAYPPLDYSSNDTRETWCWEPAPGCDRVIRPAWPGMPPWDVSPTLLNQPTRTTLGNSAWSREKWLLADVVIVSIMGRPLATDGILPAVPRPNRDYQYPWNNTWLEQRCSELAFATPTRNDLDAALANLFAGHNRMHDWSYRLGFTERTWNAQESNFGRGGREGDPEHGNAQAGAVVSSGVLNFLSRDNANQITPPDGIPPISNMFLWQPIAAAFYSKCVDGDYDMSVIGHEYTHLISNRMVAGPDQRLIGLQSNAMGESWSDLVAQEYLNEYGFVPVADENPWAVGPYAANDKERGIRNYAMNHPSSGLLPQPGVNPPVNPLNYSNVGYDLTGPQVHADGEIWSATQFDIREAMVARYNDQFPASNRRLQEGCADGRFPVTRCPGNRRWVQLVFDAWLLMPMDGQVSMLEARDAMLAADRMRFRGANQDLLWNVFASRGMGEDASTADTHDHEPRPGFSSPFATEGLVRFTPVNSAGQPIPDARLFVGHYEARTTPVADTDAETERGDAVPMVAGQYDFLAQAPGHGMMRVTRRVFPGRETVLRFVLPTNLASAHNGATATGDGVNHQFLIDDTENTNWAAFGGSARGRQVTVDLAGNTPVRVDRVNVSAMLRPPNSQDPNDPAAQNRFSALRQFEILTCTATATVNCSAPADFRSLYVSPPDAFPSIAPRPRAPELILRTFDVPRTLATHLRLRVLENQCTGTPDYQGEQDNDPLNDTDCDEARLAIVNILNGNQGNIVRAAELQVFDR